MDDVNIQQASESSGDPLNGYNPKVAVATGTLRVN
jgi:hypothetical protein